MQACTYGRVDAVGADQHVGVEVAGRCLNSHARARVVETGQFGVAMNGVDAKAVP